MHCCSSPAIFSVTVGRSHLRDGLQSTVSGAGDHASSPKNTAVTYGDTRINMLTTPGHLLISAGEWSGSFACRWGPVDRRCQRGPMPQTRFRAAQGLEQGLRRLVFQQDDRARVDPEAGGRQGSRSLSWSSCADDDQCDFSYLFDARQWADSPSRTWRLKATTMKPR